MTRAWTSPRSDAKAIAGAVTMVVGNGRIAHYEAHGLIVILMQTSTPALQRDFENAVFQAIVK